LPLYTSGALSETPSYAPVTSAEARVNSSNAIFSCCVEIRKDAGDRMHCDSEKSEPTLAHSTVGTHGLISIL